MVLEISPSLSFSFIIPLSLLAYNFSSAWNCNISSNTLLSCSPNPCHLPTPSSPYAQAPAPCVTPASYSAICRQLYAPGRAAAAYQLRLQWLPHTGISNIGVPAKAAVILYLGEATKYLTSWLFDDTVSFIEAVLPLPVSDVYWGLISSAWRLVVTASCLVQHGLDCKSVTLMSIYAKVALFTI